MSHMSLRQMYSQRCAELGCRTNSHLLGTLPDRPEQAHQLKSLDLSLNLVGNKGARAVLTVIEAANGLESLCLADNFLNNEVVRELSAAVVDHPSLHYLDFSRNPISHFSGRALQQLVEQNKNIWRVVVEGTLINPALARAINNSGELNRASTLDGKGNSGYSAGVQSALSVPMPPLTGKTPTGGRSGGEGEKVKAKEAEVEGRKEKEKEQGEADQGQSEEGCTDPGESDLQMVLNLAATSTVSGKVEATYPALASLQAAMLEGKDSSSTPEPQVPLKGRLQPPQIAEPSPREEPSDQAMPVNLSTPTPASSEPPSPEVPRGYGMRMLQLFLQQRRGGGSLSPALSAGTPTPHSQSPVPPYPYAKDGSSVSSFGSGAERHNAREGERERIVWTWDALTAVVGVAYDSDMRLGGR